MPVRSQFNVKGMAEYLEDIAQAGKDVDKAAAKAVKAGGEIVLHSMQELVPVGEAPEDPHPGNLKSHIGMTDPVQDGNYVSVTVGVSKEADANTIAYGTVQEYGSSSNQAQPYVRPAFDKNKARVKAAERKALQDEGML